MQFLRQSTASQEISLGYFLDSTDGDTEETALSIANTDIKLRKGGAIVLANKNSGGATHISNGVYYATLDATDTNTLGMLEVYVHVSGALATKNTYTVLPATAYDALITDGLFNFDPATDAVAAVTTVTQMAGTIQTLDALDTAQDAEHAVTQSLISGISAGGDVGLASPVDADNTGGALNGVTLVGTVASGTFADLAAEDGSYIVIDDATNSIDYVVGVTIPTNAVPSTVIINGYLSGAGDTVAIYVYDDDGSTWEQSGTLVGKNPNTNDSITIPLGRTEFVNSSGVIYLRFTTTAGTNQQLNLDRVIAGYLSQSVGYALGSVWIDTNASNTNTTSFVDGVADNPVSTIAAANTISTAVGLHSFSVAPSSSITFAATQQNEFFNGASWTLALGGQSISGTNITGASNGVTGTATGASPPFFKECSIGTATLPPCAMQTCGLASTLTVGSAGDYFLVDCFSQVSGASSPTIDMGAAVGSTNISIRRWAGGITVSNIASGDVISLDGVFGTVTLNGADGQVEIRGIAKAVVNNLTGSPTVNDKTLKSDSISTFDPTSDAVANVTLVDTTTTNTDMRGTDSALLASSAPTNFGDLSITATTGLTDITQTAADKIWSSSSRTLTDGIIKNQAFGNLEFLMVLASDHVTPATGLTVTGERSIDGGTFSAVTGAIAEVSNGVYQVDLLAADTNGDVITYRFSAGTADDTFITVATST